MRIKSPVVLLSFLVFFKASFATAVDTTIKPFILGETRELRSTILHENRILNIYLPEGYKEADSLRYPVIYLLDGSADEDFIHVAGLVQFYNFPWISLLPPSILVGIANVDRRRDFTFPTTIEKDKRDFPTTGGSERFMNFIEGELQPFVRENFRITNKKMIIGQSLGGLLATEILFKKPSLFDQYLIVSPSLWWNNESLLRANRQPLPDSTKVYIAVGEEGKLMKNDARALYNLLKSGNGSSRYLYFDFLKKENHATIFHKAIMHAFEKWARKPVAL